MRISRIYQDQSITVGQRLELDTGASHYLTRVLRGQLGQGVELFNGDGCSYLAKIIALDKKRTQVSVGEMIRQEPPAVLQLHLYQSLVSNDKMDLVIQKSTELGVTSITPLTTERSEVKLNSERLERKVQHWSKIAISACEQCGRNRLPTLHPTLSFNQALQNSEAHHFLMLEPSLGKSLSELESAGQFSLLVGPEGGFSDTEISLAKDAGVQLLKMGPRVLRTETAGLAALSGLQAIFGDWNQG